MAVKIVEDSAVLTLDFWDKETIYNGQVFPEPLGEGKHGLLICLQGKAKMGKGWKQPGQQSIMSALWECCGVISLKPSGRGMVSGGVSTAISGSSPPMPILISFA